MIGNEYFDQMVADAPVNFNTATVDWAGFAEAMQNEHIDPNDVQAATWCSFGQMNIEALIDASALTIIHPAGVLSSTGKRKKPGKPLQYNAIAFRQCRGFGPEEFAAQFDGKFCIEFAGAGNVLLGRLQWSWRSKRFKDSRLQTMAVAEERDRILEVVREFLK